ncbi:MAG: OmpH family outer membrane protein [Myxococcales bacterium]|nr:OmpH family outer membrane protein [Myxococcales bacterium]
MTRTLSLALALAALAAALPLAARADVKIGYVDLQRALEETEEGKKAKTKLKAEFEKKQKELDGRQEELKKMKLDLDKQAPILKPDALQAKQGELQQKLMGLQETYMRLQKDLQEKEAAETGRIFKKMKSVIAQIAQSEGITYVFEANTGILYAPPANDFTNELIRKYNAQSAGK